LFLAETCVSCEVRSDFIYISSLGIATGYVLAGLLEIRLFIPVEVTVLPVLHRVHTPSEYHPSPLPDMFDVELNNTWSCISTVPYVFIAMHLIK
jgi:hypothetical protein